MSTEVPSFDMLALLLEQSRGTALRVDSTLRICAAYNSALLDSWLAQVSDGSTAASFRVVDTLQRLFAPPQAAHLMQQLQQVAADGGAARQLGTVPVRCMPQGAVPLYVELSAQRTAAAGDHDLLLLMRDVTATHELQLACMRTQAAADTSMLLLRTDPAAIRLFLGAAMASVSALRATQRMPARTIDALRDKLSRLHAGTGQLAAEAQSIELAGVVQACARMLETLDQLQHNSAISGNDLLPLAPLIDSIANAVGTAWRCEEQRYTPPQPAGADAAAGQRSRRHASWPQASELRWNHFLRRHGEEIGNLAKLAVSGAEHVPPSIRRDVDEILQHLLRNALEHGIETPEQRLAADKPAAGQISVVFEDKGAGLRILVRDDGRGFDLQRIGQAAIKCGLISEDSLLEWDAGDLVGLIFKPAFTTEGLGESDGHGRGMTCLRNAVTRLNGQVSVATKPGRYTQFILQLPVGNSLQGSQVPAYA